MSGAWSDSVDAVRGLVAKSATFRTWCGIASGTEEEKQAAALARVHEEFAAASASRPHAMVITPNSGGIKSSKVGSSAWTRSGAVLLAFEMASGARSASDRSTDVRTLRDKVGAILDEMELVSESEGSVLLNSWEVSAVGQSDEERSTVEGGSGSETEDFLYCVVEIEWGL